MKRARFPILSSKFSVHSAQIRSRVVRPRFGALRYSPRIGIFDVLYVWILVGVSAGAWACGPVERSAEIQIKEYPVRVELAVTEKEKTCGLSFRDDLPEDRGMLFVYSYDRLMRFWMKDTRIPLSIAFLGADGTILNILEMKPMDTDLIYASSGPARYALEMPAKWFSEHRIKAGDRVAIDLSGVLAR